MNIGKVINRRGVGAQEFVQEEAWYTYSNLVEQQVLPGPQKYVQADRGVRPGMKHEESQKRGLKNE